MVKPDFSAILSTDSSRLVSDMAAEAIGNNKDYFAEVFDLAMTLRRPQNWRAIRVLDIASERCPELYLPYLTKTILHLNKTRNSSVKRCFLRILMRYVHALGENDQGILLDLCFDWFNSPDDPIAVKAYSLEILISFSEFIPELTPEILASIETQMETMNPAFRQRVKQQAIKLRKQMR